MLLIGHNKVYICKLGSGKTALKCNPFCVLGALSCDQYKKFSHVQAFLYIQNVCQRKTFVQSLKFS